MTDHGEGCAHGTVPCSECEERENCCIVDLITERDAEIARLRLAGEEMARVLRLIHGCKINSRSARHAMMNDAILGWEETNGS